MCAIGRKGSAQEGPGTSATEKDPGAPHDWTFSGEQWFWAWIPGMSVSGGSHCPLEIQCEPGMSINKNKTKNHLITIFKKYKQIKLTSIFFIYSDESQTNIDM